MGAVFITGTDTDVGKTAISAGIVRALRDAGKSVGVLKPFAAGGGGDAATLGEAAGYGTTDGITQYLFDRPCSPYAALGYPEEPPPISPVKAALERVSRERDAVVVEGIGGVMTPISRRYFVCDLVRDLGLDAVMVARNRIGSVNHTVMSAEACKDRNVPVNVVLNMIDDGYTADQLSMEITKTTGLPVLGAVRRVGPCGSAAEFSARMSRAVSKIGLDGLFC